MKQSNDRNDFYELRPFLFILIGLIGVFNSVVSAGSPAMILFGQACGIVLFFASVKILNWRREYRRRIM